MCLAAPLRLVELHENEALAEAAGIRRRIRVDFIKDARVGDYVLVHAGFAIERLREDEAQASLADWEALRRAR